MFPDALRCSQMFPDAPDVPDSSDAPRCSQMFPDVPRCFQMFPDALRSCQMAPDAPRCSQMFPDAPRYPKMFPDAPRCSQMLPDAPRCSQMLPNAPRCSQMLPDAPRCSQMISAGSDGPRSPQTGVQTMYVRGWKSRRLNCQNGDQHWVHMHWVHIVTRGVSKEKVYPMLSVPNAGGHFEKKKVAIFDNPN